jgi:KilA-N domain
VPEIRRPSLVVLSPLTNLHGKDRVGQIWPTPSRNVKSELSLRAYGEFRVVMMKDNGYVNATKMCSSGGKNYHDWSRLKGSQELIQGLETELLKGAMQQPSQNSDLTLRDLAPQICGGRSLACKIQGGNTMVGGRVISGTYVHPDLIPHIACWISVDFALKAGRVINAYITHQYKELLVKVDITLQYTYLRWRWYARLATG